MDLCSGATAFGWRQTAKGRSRADCRLHPVLTHLRGALLTRRRMKGRKRFFLQLECRRPPTQARMTMAHPLPRLEGRLG